MKHNAFLYSLLGATFLSTSALAEDGFAVTAEYLNGKTSPKVNWSEDSSSGGTAVNINGQDFYYTYTNTDGYTEVTSPLSKDGTPVTSEEVNNKLFSGIDNSSSSSGAVAIIGIGTDSPVDIESDFINNQSGTYGGAIRLTASSGGQAFIGDISGDFVGNIASNASGSGKGLGGAIYLESTATGNDAKIGDITGNFINNIANSTQSGDWTHGGAIDNHGIIQSIDANFIGNKATGSGQYVYGGAINNGKNYTGGVVIGTIHGDFIGNLAQSTGSHATGGAIRNTGTIGDIINSNFLYNRVEGNSLSRGGAIYSTNNLNISADDGTSLFEGNKANGASNAIYMLGTATGIVDLNLRAENDGALTFNDDIDGNYYNIKVLGDSDSEVVFNTNVSNVNNLSIASDAVMRMGTGARIYTNTMNDANGGEIKVDVDIDSANQTMTSGLITVSGEVSGNYRVIVNDPNASSGYTGMHTKFLTAANDTNRDDESFEVSRVIGSPYMWHTVLNYELDYEGQDTGSDWYLALEGDNGWGSDDPVETPEVVAAIGLHQAAIEQTRSVVRNVSNKVAAGREYCPNCGVYDYNWDGEKLRNLWVLVNGENAQIDKHIDMEAKIWGIEAGFDVQKDPCNTLGVFASYRRGDYDLSGDGDKYRSSIGSDIDIDSYLAGLYYRYDRNMNWLFATIYGGLQKAEIKTNDGVTEFDTDGVELGAGVEVGRTIPLNDTVTLTPSFGLYYNQVNFDEADDNVGKHYKWSTIRHAEAEAGVRLEKQFERGKLYLKPSIIRTLTGNDKVKITGMDEADTYHDQTLGRIEVGGRYGFTDAFSGYAWGNYTFGSDYQATGAGAGVSYSW